MAQIKLHLINRTKINLIFDYKSREYFVPFEFEKTIEVERGSLIYVYPEGKPDDYQQLNRTMERDAEIDCWLDAGKLYITESKLKAVLDTAKEK